MTWFEKMDTGRFGVFTVFIPFLISTANASLYQARFVRLPGILLLSEAVHLPKVLAKHAAMAGRFLYRLATHASSHR